MLARRHSVLLLALAALLATGTLRHLGWLDATENALVGVCYRLRGPRPPAPEVVVLGIDGPSLRAGSASHWPLDAAFYTDLLEALRPSGARVIALDIPGLATFDWTSEDPSRMGQFADAIRACGNVVLPAVLVPDGPVAPQHPGILRFSPGPGDLPVPRDLRTGRLSTPPPALCEAAAGLGHLNLYPDSDGIIRGLPLLTCASRKLWPSMALEVLRVFRHDPPGTARVEHGRVSLGATGFRVSTGSELAINYAGGFAHFPQLKLAQVFSGNAGQLRTALAGKIVLVGPITSDLGMLWRTPVHPVMPGVEITANAVGNLLSGKPLQPPSAWLHSGLALAYVLAFLWLAGQTSAARALLSAVAMLVVVFTGHAVLFAQGLWLPMASPLCAVALCAATMVTRAGTLADRERAEAEARLESRMHAIAGVGSLIVSSLDRDQLLNEIVRWVERELDVPAVSILLMDERRRHLRFEVASGEKGDEVKSFTLELGQGVAGTVAATGEPLIVDDARRDPRQAKDISDAVQYPTQSILCVPMMLHGEVIGVIEALNKRSGRFTDYDQSLLSVIAGQAALFLESARLYGEMQQRVEEATADLRVANRELAAQKAKVEALVDEMESGVIATDSRDRVVLWNRAAERMLGVSERVAIGQPVLAVIDHPLLSELFAMPLSPVGGRHAVELDVVVGGQSLVIRASVTLIDEADGEQGKLALLTDITQLKELDRMKTDLISFVSHELKNPLASIKGFAQLLHRATNTQSPQMKLVALLNQQTNRMQWLVEDMLDVARIDAGVALEMRWTQITDLRSLVQGIVDLQAVTDQGHTFVVDVPESLPTIIADRGKLEQVLVNLLSNACKYSPDGGEVRIAADTQNGTLELSVADEGIGISPQDQANLFQRFRRAAGARRERIAGTGIGLFLSRHLVEAHGGRIWAESRAKGTVFHLQIPLQPSANPEPDL